MDLYFRPRLAIIHSEVCLGFALSTLGCAFLHRLRLHSGDGIVPSLAIRASRSFCARSRHCRCSRFASLTATRCSNIYFSFRSLARFARGSIPTYATRFYIPSILRKASHMMQSNASSYCVVCRCVCANSPMRTINLSRFRRYKIVAAHWCSPEAYSLLRATHSFGVRTLTHSLATSPTRTLILRSLQCAFFAEVETIKKWLVFRRCLLLRMCCKSLILKTFFK